MNTLIILCTFNYIRRSLFTYPNTDVMGINYIFVDVFIWGEFRFKHSVVVLHTPTLRGKSMPITGMS